MAIEITKVYKNSPAYKAGFREGDILTHLGGEMLIDIVDFLFFSAEKSVPYTLKKPDGKIISGVIHKREEQELGIELLHDGLTRKRSCNNNCLFCFVDQLPPDMRSTLYFKDDDWRMSFIMGNYVTLTNVSEKEFERILARHVSPLYISVHATDDEVRSKLLRSKGDTRILPRLKRLAQNGQYFNCQAVLCPGINDGEVLEKSIAELYSLFPYASSFAVVPVGLTAHREGLHPLKPFTKEQAAKVIEIVERWQNKALSENGTRFVFASDELYITAGLPLPDYEAYEDFLQLEDGVGLTSMLLNDARLALETADECRNTCVSIACGVDAESTLNRVAAMVKERFDITINVYPVKNSFFGESITVSGLITGKDLISTLKGKELGSRVIITDAMLRDRENLFLDDVTTEQICGILNTEICPVCDGFALVDAILGI